LTDIVTDFLTVLKRSASLQKCGHVHKNIGPAIFWRDEAKTFIVIEKLYSANCHVILFYEAIKVLPQKIIQCICAMQLFTIGINRSDAIIASLWYRPNEHVGGDSG